MRQFRISALEREPIRLGHLGTVIASRPQYLSQMSAAEQAGVIMTGQIAPTPAHQRLQAGPRVIKPNAAARRKAKWDRMNRPIVVVVAGGA